MVRERTILWRAGDGGLELCRLRPHGEGYALAGTVVRAQEGAPCAIEYRVETDAAGATVRVFCTVERGGAEPWRAELGSGDLLGCADVDFGFTPATNTLPLRRLVLREGDGHDVTVALLLWPELTLERSPQRYERLAADRYRFSAGSFAAELTVDEDGLVTAYADLWRAVAHA